MMQRCSFMRLLLFYQIIKKRSKIVDKQIHHLLDRNKLKTRVDQDQPTHDDSYVTAVKKQQSQRFTSLGKLYVQSIDVLRERTIARTLYIPFHRSSRTRKMPVRINWPLLTATVCPNIGGLVSGFITQQNMSWYEVRI